MNINQEIPEGEFEQIERYLSDQMGSEEKVSFAERLSVDADLRKKTKELKLIFISIQEKILEDRLAAFHVDIKDTIKLTPGKRNLVKFPLEILAAASIVLLLGFLTWKGFYSEPKAKQLFSDFYKPDPGLVGEMGISENYAFDRAMIEYKLGNYKSAIKSWDSLQLIHPDNDTLVYFLGSAYLGDRQAKQAEKYLYKLNAKKGTFASDAAWYLGLALLKQGKDKEAIVYFKQSNHPQKYKILQKLVSR